MPITLVQLFVAVGLCALLLLLFCLVIVLAVDEVRVAILTRLHDALHRTILPVILNHLVHMEKRLMAQIDDLKAAAARETAVDASVVALLQELSAQLAAANNSQGAPNPDVQAVIDSMNANATSLAAAVAVNTPIAANPSASSAPTPVQDPAPAPVADPAPAPVADPAPAPTDAPPAAV